MPEIDDYWNHNTRHHPFILDAIPEGATSALDIGCGDGLLARKLATRIDRVVGVDVSPAMIELARARTFGADGPTGPTFPTNPTFLQASFLDQTDGLLAAGMYDLVTAVSVIHHVDFAPAISAVRRLLAPGGRLVVIGLANDFSPVGLAYEVVNIPATRILSLKHGGTVKVPDMPVRNATMRTVQVRRESRRLLPGSRFHRRLLWRYSLLWDKPRTA
jgi:SAM-dependent methyltransferase